MNNCLKKIYRYLKLMNKKPKKKQFKTYNNKNKVQFLTQHNQNNCKKKHNNNKKHSYKMKHNYKMMRSYKMNYNNKMKKLLNKMNNYLKKI